MSVNAPKFVQDLLSEGESPTAIWIESNAESDIAAAVYLSSGQKILADGVTLLEAQDLIAWFEDAKKDAPADA